MSAADYEIPLSAYEDEPAARGMRLERGPAVDLPSRRPPADSPVQPWPWRPTRSLAETLAAVLVYLQEEIRADAVLETDFTVHGEVRSTPFPCAHLAAANLAAEEKAA